MFGQITWHGMLDILHKTHPEHRIPASAGCPKQGFQCNFIPVLRRRLGCGLVNKIGNREQNDSLSLRQEPQN